MKPLPVLLPNAASAIIDLAKLVSYALDPEHPVGKHKARAFAALGITRANAAALAEQIRRGIRTEPAQQGQVDLYGRRFTVDIRVSGSRRQGVARTAWLLEHGSGIPRLVTLYVL